MIEKFHSKSIISRWEIITIHHLFSIRPQLSFCSFLSVTDEFSNWQGSLSSHILSKPNSESSWEREMGLLVTIFSSHSFENKSPLANIGLEIQKVELWIEKNCHIMFFSLRWMVSQMMIMMIAQHVFFSMWISSSHDTWSTPHIMWWHSSSLKVIKHHALNLEHIHITWEEATPSNHKKHARKCWL